MAKCSAQWSLRIIFAVTEKVLSKKSTELYYDKKIVLQFI
uniref:Bm13509, isoform a n=1 Tax=Brugia malayi TaxID=6279 RepID=A0A1I9G3N5_BRUMA|nr:Bm13509, isoform a [Brugia malayi]